MKLTRTKIVCLFGAVFFAQTVWSASPAQQRLPEPLTLEAALSIAAEQDPRVMLAQAKSQQANAQLAALSSIDSFKIKFDGGLVRREFNGREEDFNNAYLTLQKQLYDFNRTSLAQSAAQTQLQAEQALERLAVSDYRQSVIQAFYDVLLADAAYTVENEQLAIEYVDLDHAKEELAVGKLSELDVAALDEPYQRTLVRRALAESQQRNTRAALAELLGFHNKLPETLVPPKQTDLLKRKLEDPKVLQSKALENNPELKAAQLMIEAAELALQSAEKMNMPRIDAIGRAGWHSQVETLYEGRWRADLAVSMPIFDGGLKDAQVDKAKAELNKQRAMRLSLERQTRQAVLETALAIERLKTRQNQVKVAGDFAERYLDKSRTEYQFERKTDLGDSMVRVSRAEYEVLQLQRDRAVLWDSLSKLLGE